VFFVAGAGFEPKAPNTRRTSSPSIDVKVWPTGRKHRERSERLKFAPPLVSNEDSFPEPVRLQTEPSRCGVGESGIDLRATGLFGVAESSDVPAQQVETARKSETQSSGSSEPNWLADGSAQQNHDSVRCGRPKVAPWSMASSGTSRSVPSVTASH
jgi:hypothetical protein